MTLLILGLLVFLGAHSIHMIAPGLREAGIDKLGVWGWKGLFAVVSIAGFVFLVMGYGEARVDPTWLWHSPGWMSHLVALLMIPAMILLVAAYVPGTHMRARMGHPMLLATKIWALAHLLANGDQASMLLFGGFLAWAVADRILVKRRGERVPVQAEGRTHNDITAVVAGLALYFAFVFALHEWLIGVPVLP